MSPTTPGEVTQLLERSQRGDRDALDRLYGLIEAELRRLARTRLGALRASLRPRGVEPSQQTTELVNDAFLNLVGDDKDYASRAHFVGVAAYRMRSLCRDYARHALAAKRGRTQHVSLADVADFPVAPALSPEEFLAVDQALERLAELDPRQARIVDLRCWAGLTEEEVARLLGVSTATVKREWRSARAWLQRTLARHRSASAGGDAPAG